MFRVIATAVVTAILTSAFWIFAYNTGVLPTAEARKVKPAGDVNVVDPATGPPVAIAEGVEVGPAGLAIPVVGVKAEPADRHLHPGPRRRRARPRRDRHHGRRGHAGGRGDRGTVEKLFFSQGGGGITAYVRSPDQRWTYYYAHLQGYAPGLAEGQRVKRGQLIGRVGHTGNASPGGPHLHFAINRMEPGEKWWQGTPINPYPLLAGKRTSG